MACRAVGNEDFITHGRRCSQGAPAERSPRQDALCESPSIGIICPEIDRAASEARKTASAAISAGSTKRLSDWLASAAAGGDQDALWGLCRHGKHSCKGAKGGALRRRRCG